MAATEADAVRLAGTTDAHFAWMLGEGPAPSSSLRLPPGGIEATQTLTMLRENAARLRETCRGGNWMIVVENEVVGLCSYRGAPSADGTVEIGYGIAQSRRGRGYATRAIARILEYAIGDPSVRCVTAGTAPGNVASQRALQTNGFAAAGSYVDPKWGDSILWRRDLHKGSEA